MKLTTAQRKRLAALLNQSTYTADETTELNNLKAIALGDSLDLATIKAEHSADGDDPMSADELSTLVEKSVSKALIDSGVSHEKLAKSIGASLAGTNSFKAEDIETAVKTALSAGGLDVAALTSAIKSAIGTTTPGMTRDEFTAEMTKALESFGKNFRQPAVHEFGVGAAMTPIAHRSGNLSIGQKQLLNLCLANCTDQLLEQTGAKRPTGMNDGILPAQLAKAVEFGDRMVRDARDNALYGKALTTGAAGVGKELMAADISSEIQTRFYMESALATMLVASEIVMPSNPFTIPLITSRPRFRKGGENPGSNPNSSDPNTAPMVLNAKKMIGITDYSYETDEDGIIAMLPMLIEGLSAGAAEAFEDVVINGDTTATHMDSDTHAAGADDRAKTLIGLRKMCIAASLTSSWATNNVHVSNIKALRKLLKRWGMNTKDLLLICGTNGYNDLVGLDETLTFEKVGSSEQARILTGVAGSIFGVKIVPSAMVRENLNATGVYDGTTTTKGGMLLIHRPSFYVGVRRGFMVETDSDKKQQVNSVIASFRRDFIPKETLHATNAPMAAYAINYNS